MHEASSSHAWLHPEPQSSSQVSPWPHVWSHPTVHCEQISDRHSPSDSASDSDSDSASASDSDSASASDPASLSDSDSDSAPGSTAVRLPQPNDRKSAATINGRHVHAHMSTIAVAAPVKVLRTFAILAENVGHTPMLASRKIYILSLLAAACRAPERHDPGNAPTADAGDGAAVVADAGTDAGADAAPDAFAFQHAAMVADHVDGDTFDVDFLGDDVRVRLMGVDTPELFGDDAPEPWAPEAATFTREATPLGTAVGLEFDDERCVLESAPAKCFTFDRLLAYVRLPDGRDLGAELLSAGLGTFFDSDCDRCDAYRQLAQQAQQDNVGIWSD